MTRVRLVRRLGLGTALIGTWVGQAAARMLDVGPGRAYAAPGAAAARDGDTVRIAPGTYYDCALWRPNGLTIVGSGPGVVITDRACVGKAAFVVQGDNVTISGLSFARVRVVDGNGAGIRVEGQDLTVTDSRFVNNQVGILAGGRGGSLRISGCDFDGNGVSWDGQATHAVLAGSLDLLRIQGSSFRGARGGDQIASHARRAELVDNELVDEGGRMSGPLPRVDGGALVFEHNTVDLPRGAIPVSPKTLLFLLRYEPAWPGGHRPVSPILNTANERRAATMAGFRRALPRLRPERSRRTGGASKRRRSTAVSCGPEYGQWPCDLSPRATGALPDAVPISGAFMTPLAEDDGVMNAPLIATLLLVALSVLPRADFTDVAPPVCKSIV